jgi:hypothetical protein
VIDRNGAEPMATCAEGLSCLGVARIFEGDGLALGYHHVGDVCDGTAHTWKDEHLIGLGHDAAVLAYVVYDVDAQPAKPFVG